MKTKLFSLLLGATLIAGCSDNPASPDMNPGPDQVAEVNQYLNELPDWDTFSPQKSAQPPTATADPEPLEDVMLDVEMINDNGEVEIIPDVTYSCQSQPFTLTDNPEQIALYSPDRDILWPGALIQGKSHRDGLGSLLGLPIAERTPIQVSIPSLANDDNFRTVDTPSQAEVDQAIGSMIGGATTSGLSTPSTITFKMEAYHSESQFALQAGLSGHYLGFEGSAQGSVDKNASKTTVTAQFYQKMFEVVVAPPQSPGAFFSDDFNTAKLQEQVNLGRIGRDNLPVYVANVVYGRMMMFSMTSTASESDIRATMSAAYEGIGGGVSANLSVRQQAILQESEIRVTSLGGDAEATLGIIRSGDWSAYFTDSAPLTSAAPLSYTFRNLSDGSIASVSETTEYNITTCEARAATPGTFDLLNVQSLGLPIDAPATVMMADINGDEMDDIVWNHVGASENETVIGIADGRGGFSLTPVFEHPGTPTDNWGGYNVAVGDFNNDGMDDLAWSKTVGYNETFVTYSNGDGSFTALDPWQRPEQGWSNFYTFTVGDFDGKNGDDLAWNYRQEINRTYVSLNNGDGTFTAEAGKFQDHSTSWYGYPTVHVVDLNSDGRDDLLWPGLDGTSLGVYPALAVGETEGNIFSYLPNTRPGSGDWSVYDFLVGDIDGGLGEDVVMVGPRNAPDRVYRYVGNGSGGFSFKASQITPFQEDSPLVYRLLDVNGDGTDDLLMNKMDTVNRSYIGLGTASAEFDFSPIPQTHPAVDNWSQFDILVGDVNGDGREDVIYNNADVSNDVYVGLARE